MVAREHVERVAARCCAETAEDRDAWLSRFAPDATVEAADGSRIQGVDAMRASFHRSGTQPDPA